MNFDAITIDEIASFLAHPLIVVIFGGIVASIVGHRFTRSWEERKIAFEIRNKLITEMIENLTRLMAMATRGEMMRDNPNREEVRGMLVPHLSEWRIFSQIFSAKLRTYFPKREFPAQWSDVFEAAYAFTHLTATFPVAERHEHLDKLRRLLHIDVDNPDIDFDLLANREVAPGGELEGPFATSWQNLRTMIEEKGNSLAGEILTTRIIITG